MFFLEGYLIGLAMIIFIGPVFFLLLSISISSGIRNGSAVAIGIIVSDLICFLICNFAASSFHSNPNFQFWICLVGGFLLLFLGLKYIFSKNEINLHIEQIPYHSLATSFTKGFMVNFINPFVFSVWVGVIAFIKNRSNSSEDFYLFILGVLLGIFSTDFLKVLLSSKLKNLISTRNLKIIFFISGLILIGFAFRLFYICL